MNNPDSSNQCEKIVSLSEFRERVKNPVLDEIQIEAVPEQDLHKFLTYRPDYQSRFVVASMLEYLNNGDATEKVAILSRFVMTLPADVRATTKGDGWYYLVDKNYPEFEEIAADLGNIPDTEARRIGLPKLERFYTASLVAHQVIKSTCRFKEDRAHNLPPPVTGADNPIILNDTERMREIRMWQAASGLGVLAVSPDQPSNNRLRKYLNNVLEHRFYYARDLRALEADLGIKVFGLGPPDGDEISDRLIGVGNPLEPEQLKRVLDIKIRRTKSR